MRCQIVCPLNKPFIEWIEDTGEFTEEETEIILQNNSIEKFSPSTIEKIKLLGLEDCADVLARNLRVLIGNSNYKL